MTAKILSGTAIAAEMRDEIAERVAALQADRGVQPGLAVLLVGDDPASRSYVTAKERACKKAGIYSEEVRLPADATLEEILAVIDRFNTSKTIDGILVQLPLPDWKMEEAVIDSIVPEKDVDGFHPVSVGKMLLGRDTYLPCTPHGILHILKRSDIPTKGAHVVVIGRSNIVGRPLVNMLTQKSDLGNATVTMCHTATKDLKAHTLQADIVVAAAGRPNVLTADMVKEGAVVIDVGVNRVEDSSRERGYRLVGDADYEGLLGKASAITPVPGGVGPMTITMLLYNTLQSAELRAEQSK